MCAPGPKADTRVRPYKNISLTATWYYLLQMQAAPAPEQMQAHQQPPGIRPRVA
jgi:hypothetical protein